MGDYDTLLKIEIERHRHALDDLRNGVFNTDSPLPAGFVESPVGRECQRAQIEMLTDAIEMLESMLTPDAERLAA